MLHIFSILLKLCLCTVSHIQLLATPQTVACQAPLSMGFSWQGHWVAISSPGDLPNPGIEPVSPTFRGRFFTTHPPGRPILKIAICYSK